MPLEAIEISTILAAEPQRIYDGWLSGEGHSAFTSSSATVDPVPGGRFTAFEGYIEGTNVELEPPRRIVQRWRTTEFPPGAEDSLLTVLLEPAAWRDPYHAAAQPDTRRPGGDVPGGLARVLLWPHGGLLPRGLKDCQRQTTIARVADARCPWRKLSRGVPDRWCARHRRQEALWATRELVPSPPTGIFE